MADEPEHTITVRIGRKKLTLSREAAAALIGALADALARDWEKTEIEMGIE